MTFLQFFPLYRNADIYVSLRYQCFMNFEHRWYDGIHHDRSIGHKALAALLNGLTELDDLSSNSVLNYSNTVS